MLLGVDGGRGRSTHLPLGTRPAVTEDAGGQPPGPPRALQRLPPLPPSPLLESPSRRPARAVPRGALGTFDDALGRGDLRAPPGHGLFPAPAARTTRAAAFLPSGLRSAGRQPPCRAPEDGASSDGGGRSAAPSLRRRPAGTTASRATATTSDGHNYGDRGCARPGPPRARLRAHNFPAAPRAAAAAAPCARAPLGFPRRKLAAPSQPCDGRMLFACCWPSSPRPVASQTSPWGSCDLGTRPAS